MKSSNPALVTAVARRGFTLLLSGFICVTLLASCARVKVEQKEATSEPLAKPDVIVVHDFSVSPDQVELDHTIGLRLQGMIGSNSDAKERLRLAQEISQMVTKDLVEDLRKRGLNAVDASSPVPAGRVLSIQGQYFSIDQGSKRRRLIIGFGSGASVVRTLVQVFEETGAEPRLVEDFYVNVESSRRPGMGPMAGAGAAGTEAAASVAASSTGALIGASGQTVEADARHLAEQISKELKNFFVKHHWVDAKG